MATGPGAGFADQPTTLEPTDPEGGLMLNVEPDQRLGFYGATPVARQPRPTTLEEAIEVLVSLGLVAP